MNARRHERADDVVASEPPQLEVVREDDARPDRPWAEVALAGEKRVLEMIAGGECLSSILEALCRVVEETCQGSHCSILLLDAKGERLWQGAAPSLPKSYLEVFNGREIASCDGPCAAAAFRKGQVIAADIQADPRWAGCRDLALSHGLRACWSTPIFSPAEQVLGTLAILSNHPRSPTPEDQDIIRQFTHLASIAIERKRAEEAVRVSAQLARGQAEALTRTLDALAKESAPERLVEHVLRTIICQLDAHSSGVWVRDEATGLVNFGFAFENGRLLTEAEATLARISPTLRIEDVAPWPELFRTGKPSVLADIRECPPFPWREHVLSLGVITILMVPMLIAGQVEGVIGIRFTCKRTFRAEELDLAQALAHQAMLAIQLSRLSRQSRQAAVAAERNRLARDIHDTLAQGLTGVIVQLEAVEEAMARRQPAKAEECLARAGRLARESLQEARRSVQALRPRALEENDFCEALKALVLKMTEGTGLQASFTVNGEPRDLPLEWEENLLHVGQEVLTNVLRHAQATHFTAQVAFDEGEVRLHMRDNGRGFDPAGRHDGFGLQGMRERVKGMGGWLSIHSPKGEGTAIAVVIPLANALQQVAA